MTTGDDDDDDDDDDSFNTSEETIGSNRSNSGGTLPAAPMNHPQNPKASNIKKKKIPKLPCVPSLDADGPLPRGSYLPSSTVSGQCRVQIAWDVSPLWNSNNNNNNKMEITSEDVAEMVATVQRFADAGLTSFQIQQAAEKEKDAAAAAAALGRTPHLRLADS